MGIVRSILLPVSQVKQNHFISSETVTYWAFCNDNMWSVCCTNWNQIDVVLTSVNFSVFTDFTKRKANGMASEWSYKNQNSSYRGKFQWIKGNKLVRASREFELSEFELTQLTE